MTTIPASYSMAGGGFPASLDVDPPAAQNRLTVLLRLLFAIPSAIGLAIVGIVAGIITVIAWLVILITGKYPAGMMSFAEGYVRWAARTYGYLYLLTDKYPPFALGEDSAYPVRPVVNGQTDGRSRLTVFFRYIMAIPHLIILGLLNYAMSVVGFIAWLMALFTGTVPAGLHNFIAGYVRWNLRVQTYILLLTDVYPPFSLS